MRKLSFRASLLACVLAFSSSLAAQDLQKHKGQTALLGRARFLLETWQYEKAIDTYKKLIPIQVTSGTFVGGPEAHVRLGECFFHLGRYQEAALWFELTMDRFPEGSGHYYMEIKFGDVYVKLGQLDKARKAYKIAQRLPLVDINIEDRIKRLRKMSQPKDAADTK